MTQFEPLLEVTAVLKEKAIEAHRRNTENSKRLAAELEQIDALRHAVQADTQTIGARQMLGSDALYQSWLLRNRAEILRQAAMARAKEHDSLAKAKTAFSQVEAAQELDQKLRDRLRSDRLQKQGAYLDELSVLRRFQSDQ